MGSRTSYRSATDFSSTAKTSSILSMYSSVTSATHHIFFPPRLQVVVLQKNPDCFSTHARHQLSFDGLFNDEAQAPPGVAFGRFAADHGYNALLFRGVKQFGGTRT